MENIELLITADEINQRICWAAEELNVKYEGEELTLVMVMKGALCLTADLMRHLQVPCTVEYVQASSYGQRGSEKGELTLIGIASLDLSGKNVLLIDDIFDTGNTLYHVLETLKQKNPKKIETLVLLNKKVSRERAFAPDYSLFEIENLFVVGYGLDYKEYYRGLPGIYHLRPEA